MSYQGKKPRYILKYGNWELTLRCTLHCQHCGSQAGEARSNELSLNECFRVADELLDLGCFDMTLIGGEVFLYKGWEKLAAYMTDNGMMVNIVSNGYKIGDREIEQIQHSKITSIGLSVDGAPETHNQIRGKNDAFTRLEQSIERLRKAEIPMTAITSIMKLNYGDLESIYSFLSKRDFKAWQLQLVNAMGNMSGRHDVFITPQEVEEITKFIQYKNLFGRMVVAGADDIGYFNAYENYIRGMRNVVSCWGGCAAGLTGLFIDSVGNVKGCGALYSDEFIEGNIRSKRISEIWNDENAFAYNRKFNTDLLEGSCKDCDVSSVCKGGCRSSNYFSNGSLYSNSFCCHHLP